MATVTYAAVILKAVHAETGKPRISYSNVETIKLKVKLWDPFFEDLIKDKTVEVEFGYGREGGEINWFALVATASGWAETTWRGLDYNVQPGKIYFYARVASGAKNFPKGSTNETLTYVSMRTRIKMSIDVHNNTIVARVRLEAQFSEDLWLPVSGATVHLQVVWQNLNGTLNDKTNYTLQLDSFGEAEKSYKMAGPGSYSITAYYEGEKETTQQTTNTTAQSYNDGRSSIPSPPGIDEIIGKARRRLSNLHPTSETGSSDTNETSSEEVYKKLPSSRGPISVIYWYGEALPSSGGNTQPALILIARVDSGGQGGGSDSHHGTTTSTNIQDMIAGLLSSTSASIWVRQVGTAWVGPIPVPVYRAFIGVRIMSVYIEISFDPIGAILQIVLSTITMGLSDIIMGALGINLANPQLEQLDPPPAAEWIEEVVTELFTVTSFEIIARIGISFGAELFSRFVSEAKVVAEVIGAGLYAGSIYGYHLARRLFGVEDRDIRRSTAICSAIMIILRVLEWRGDLEKAFSKILERISWPREVADKFLTLLTKLERIEGFICKIREALSEKPSTIGFIAFLIVDMYYLAAPYLGWPV